MMYGSVDAPASRTHTSDLRRIDVVRIALLGIGFVVSIGLTSQRTSPLHITESRLAKVAAVSGA